MKSYRDEGVAEVRAARAELCARFDNNPRRLLTYLRQRQRLYRGRIIKNWSELKPSQILTERPDRKRQK
jgi:hypothetical protein